MDATPPLINADNQERPVRAAYLLVLYDRQSRAERDKSPHFIYGGTVVYRRWRGVDGGVGETDGKKISEAWAQSTGHKNGLFVKRAQRFEEYDFV